MKLGILINTDKHLAEIIGITISAVSKGHEVLMFAMDEGVRLLEDRSFIGLIDNEKISITYCNFNVEKLGVGKDLVPDDIVSGSQYDNAVMMHEADKVIVL